MREERSSSFPLGGNRLSPKSVRLSSEEARRVALAAERLGKTTSDLMREAVLARCDEVLTEDLGALLSDVIGVLDLPGGPQARDSKKVFAEGIEQKLARRRKLP